MKYRLKRYALFDSIPNKVEQVHVLRLDAKRGSDLAGEDFDLFGEFIEALRVLARGVHVHRDGLAVAIRQCSGMQGDVGDTLRETCRS